jgi:hypothetical protein
MHRALRLNVPQDAVRLGVAGYTKPEDNSLADLFLLPFRKQRDYWGTPDDRPSHTRTPDAGSGL